MLQAEDQAETKALRCKSVVGSGNKSLWLGCGMKGRRCTAIQNWGDRKSSDCEGPRRFETSC